MYNNLQFFWISRRNLNAFLRVCVFLLSTEGKFQTKKTGQQKRKDKELKQVLKRKRSVVGILFCVTGKRR